MAITLLRFDMRAPAFSPASTAELYAAALEMGAWADERGFDSLTLSEHHGADDGFLPSPIAMLGCLVGRTRRIRLGVAALLLPLYDPVKLAEDLAVLDIAMPELNGVETTKLIRQETPECRVLVLSMHGDPAYVRGALRAGASGYLLKEAIDSELVTAIRAVAQGQAYLSPAISSTVLADYQKHVSDPLDSITPRERTVTSGLRCIFNCGVVQS